MLVDVAPWLNTWTFDRFVTLAFNNPLAGDARLVGSSGKYVFLRERLRKWDAHVNHAMFGKYWAKRDADRTFSFYALEKPDSNPHWHGLIRFFTDDPVERERQGNQFDKTAEELWVKLVPSGTVDVQPIDEQIGAAEYIAKSLPYGVLFEHLVIADEFAFG